MEGGTGTSCSWISFIHALAAERCHHPQHLTLLCSLSVTSPVSTWIRPAVMHFPPDRLGYLPPGQRAPPPKWVHLGTPCSFNACRTTFRSLLTLSTRCPRLQDLCIHINTTTLIQDIGSVPEDDQRMEVRRSQAQVLGEWIAYLTLALFTFSLSRRTSVSATLKWSSFDISATTNNVIVFGSSTKPWATRGFRRSRSTSRTEPGYWMSHLY